MYVKDRRKIALSNINELKKLNENINLILCTYFFMFYIVLTVGLK